MDDQNSNTVQGAFERNLKRYQVWGDAIGTGLVLIALGLLLPFLIALPLSFFGMVKSGRHDDWIFHLIVSPFILSVIGVVTLLVGLIGLFAAIFRLHTLFRNSWSSLQLSRLKPGDPFGLVSVGRADEHVVEFHACRQRKFRFACIELFGVALIGAAGLVIYTLLTSDDFGIKSLETWNMLAISVILTGMAVSAFILTRRAKRFLRITSSPSEEARIEVISTPSLILKLPMLRERREVIPASSIRGIQTARHYNAYRDSLILHTQLLLESDSVRPVPLLPHGWPNEHNGYRPPPGISVVEIEPPANFREALGWRHGVRLWLIERAAADLRRRLGLPETDA